MSSLISAFDTILSDLDGVVYAGPEAIDGAVESLNRAEEEGIIVAYVTNNASRSVDTVAEHLNSLGLHTDGRHVVSAAQSAAALAARRLEPGSPVQVCGASALADCARAEGLRVVAPGEGAQAVLQGFNPELSWQDLAEASYALSDPEVLWIASNTDLTIPKERGIAPGNGTLVAAVATATRREPLVAGKPGATIFATATDRLGAGRPVVIGDRLDTDIRGASHAEIPSICVMTGVQTYEDVLNAVVEERPTYLLSNLRELFEPHELPVVTFEGERTRAVLSSGEEAWADAHAVHVSAPTGSLNGWKAATTAWWAAHPGLQSPTAAEVHWS